ncbi:hypothetical protein BJ165DRAFT_1522880 [Panaeolus papilionaceus]|nr:hypothetical protein BJ165DRAFT_1522880 [Panaeolus papilionaceus]
MAGIVSYFWPGPDAPTIDEKSFETTPMTLTIPLGDKSTTPAAAKGLCSVLKSRFTKWQQLQTWLHANLLRVQSYKPMADSEKLQAVDVVTDKWPTVLEYIQTNKPDDDQKIKLCLDLANAVLNLHNNNFPHGAIRGNNVYVRSDGVCLLGLPAPFHRPSKDDLSTYKGWMSPEIRNASIYQSMRVDHHHNYQGEFRLPNDIYMLASTFSEIFAGQVPLSQPVPGNVKDLARSQEVVFETKETTNLIPTDILNIMKKMRSLIPGYRLNADTTVDALLCPLLARQRHSSNYINSKAVARGVVAKVAKTSCQSQR